MEGGEADAPPDPKLEGAAEGEEGEEGAAEGAAEEAEEAEPPTAAATLTEVVLPKVHAAIPLMTP